MMTRFILSFVTILLVSQLLAVIATPYVVTWEESDVTTTSTSRPLLGQKKCTYGPAYWCHNITQAKQCGAMKHCIKKVWEPMVLPEDNDSVCQICKEMVKEARDQLLSNETQDELRQVLEGSCNLIPLKLIAKECSDFMDEFIPELIDALASRMDPQVVCAVSGLCNSLRIDEMLGEMKDIDSDGNTILSLNVPKQPFDLSKDSCPKCTHFIGKAVTYFQGLKKEELKDKILEICGHLSSYSDSCRGIAMQELDSIYSHVQNNMNSQEMCGLVGLCNVVSIHPVKIETSASSVRVWTPPVNDDELQCDFCKQLVNYLRTWLTSDTTQEEFQKIVDGLCKETGKYTKECLNLAKEYSGAIYQLLIDECDPENVCTRIGQCIDPKQTGRVKLFGSTTNTGPIWTILSLNYSSNDLKIEKLLPGEKITGEDEKNSHRPGFVYPMMQLRPGERLTGDDEQNGLEVDPELCKICIEITIEAQKYFRKHLNATTEELAKYVNEFCHLFMEPPMADKCHKIVAKYGRAFVITMINYLNPDNSCTGIHVCPEPTVVIEEVVVPKIVKDILPTCSLCQFTITKLYDLIGLNKSKEAIDSAVDSVCYVIPKTYQTECLEFMKQYGERVVEMILIEGSAHEICAALHLCLFRTQSSVTPTPAKLVGNSYLPFDRYLPKLLVESAMTKLKETYPDIHTHLQESIDTYNQKQEIIKEKSTCALCEFAITQLDNRLGDNATQEEITKEVKQVCKYLPRTVQDECNGFIDQYGELIIQYLVNSMDPKQICIELKLCDGISSSIPAVEYPMSLHMDKCELCILLSDYLSEFLDDPKVDTSIDKLVEKICPLLPTKYLTECKNMIEDYGPYLLSLLAQETDKGKACAQVNLCPAK